MRKLAQFTVFKKVLNITLCLSLALGLSACSTFSNRVAVPESLTANAIVPSLTDVRFYADAPPLSNAQLKQIAIPLKQRMRAHPDKNRTLDILSLSGGGSDGAFGAGLLNGWSQSGKRPKFDVVTGVSTGAIIAPFAFLGPAYDPQLKEIYTTLSTKQVLQANILSGLFGGPALTDNSGLITMIAKYATHDLLNKIGQEHLKGRFLLIGTSDLDSQRGIIWDIGKLANSNHPQKLKLFRKIILASTSIPGAFPPVRFDVEANGKTYTELHVDGGISSQVFLYPSSFSPRRLDALLGIKRKRRVFVIRNSTVTPQYDVTEAKLLEISTRSISTLIKNQGIGDLYRVYALAKRDGLDYNLAYVPPSFTLKKQDVFDTKYMQALYKVGEQMGRTGNFWHKSPFILD